MKIPRMQSWAFAAVAAILWAGSVTRAESDDPGRLVQFLRIGEVTVVVESDEHCPPGVLPNDHELHRRDLNVTPAIYLQDGEPFEALQALGGVFRLEFFGFEHPIFVTSAGATVDKGFKQELNQYEAATVNLFDARSSTMHTVILGGISGRMCTSGQSGVETPQCTHVVPILGFPSFVADGTILSCQGGSVAGGDFTCGGIEQVLLHRPYLTHNPDLPTGMLGANAHFFPAPEIAAHDNGVIRLEALPAGEYARVGTIYGGIEVAGEPPGNPFFTFKAKSHSKASALAFAVMIKPR